MNLSASKVNPLIVRLGFWSSMICLSTFVIFTVCFIGIMFVNPLFLWTNLQDFISYTKVNNQFLKHLAEFSMLLFGMSFVVLASCIHELVPQEKKILSRIGLYFGVLFAGMIGINYFIQLSAVRLSIIKDEIAGLEQMVQGNPISGIAAINMLGWSVFFAISSLFLAPLFSGSRVANVVKYSLLANGIICLLGGIGYVLDNFFLVLFCMNLGMGGAVFVATLALAVWFKRLGGVEVTTKSSQKIGFIK